MAILLATPVAKADCYSDCKAALDSADKVINSLKDEISTRKALEAKQKDIIASQITTINEQSQELGSWLRNPILIGILGMAVGTVTTVLIIRR